MSRQLGGTDLKRLHREWRRRTNARLSLILDGVQSPFNVGSILRSAAAYGVGHLWLTENVPDPGSTKVAKTALGCQRYLTWSTAETGSAAITDARAQGFMVIGLELTDNAVPIHELAIAGETGLSDICLVVGHEDRGSAKDTLASCDSITYLPLVGRVGSLNVAVATAVALADLRRQDVTAGHQHDRREP